MPRCTKCKKKFVSQYLLDKHMNREIPCDQEIKCEKCGRLFDIKRDLERHSNRKTPCVKFINQNINLLQLEIEKEKTKREEEKTKQEEEKTRRQIEKLKLKKEIMEKESENKQKEIEIKMNKNLEIEQAKTYRKEKTATIINNDNRVQTINNTINIINNAYYNDKLITDVKEIKKQIEYHSNKLCNCMVDIWYENARNSSDFIEKLLSFHFNNEKFPEMNIIIHDIDSSEFYLADKDGFKHIEFKDINPYISYALEKSFPKINNIIEESKQRGENAIMKYNVIIKASINNLKSMQFIKSAKNALNPTNKFKLDENEDEFGAIGINAYKDEYD